MSYSEPVSGRVKLEGMVLIRGGTFMMGSDRHYPEEAPAHPVRVDDFWMDSAPVTNAAFSAFVRATGHVTFAELPPDPKDYPGAKPDMLQPGSLVFTRPARPVDLRDLRNWWEFRFGADHLHPDGPGSGLDGLLDHPVVHIAYSDAVAYAEWAGKQLPTEAEWEFAARGGLDGAEFAWGNELKPDGRWMANIFQGTFPWKNTAEDGYQGTSPVRAFPANGYGLFDMIGNVWEWTSDWYTPRHARASGCCVPENPLGGLETQSFDPRQPRVRIPRKVLKGGSHLCSLDYCRRYRPAARFPEPVDTTASHVGFRCVVRAASSER